MLVEETGTSRFLSTFAFIIVTNRFVPHQKKKKSHIRFRHCKLGFFMYTCICASLGNALCCFSPFVNLPEQKITESMNDSILLLTVDWLVAIIIIILIHSEVFFFSLRETRKRKCDHCTNHLQVDCLKANERRHT